MRKRIVLIALELYGLAVLVKLSAWLLNQPSDFAFVAAITLILATAFVAFTRGCTHINYFLKVTQK